MVDQWSSNRLWTQNSAGVSDSNENNDNFGATLAIGDFNGDGRRDLACAVPQETLSASQAGLVHVLFQSSSNVLTGTGSVALVE